jgi:hypothetical protein
MPRPVIFALGLSLAAFAFGTAQAEDKRLDLGPVHSVHVANLGTLSITVGEAQSLLLSAPDGKMDRLEVDFEGGVLRIKRQKSWFGGDDAEPYQARLSVQSLDALTVSGGTKATVRGIAADRFALEIAGAAKLDIVGTCATLTLEASGANTLFGQGLRCDEVSLEAAGANDLHVFASKAIGVKAAGANSVTVHGTPQRLENNSAGANKVRLADG